MAVPKSVGGGRFEIGQRLGSGSFGDVYRGLDVETRAPVAIKFEDGQTQQLQKELEVLRLFQGEGEKHCQGFAKILYFGRKGERFCLVMECLGKSLEERLRNCGGTLNVKTTTLVAQQMVGCIEMLHSKGVVHRDIKPDNFMCGVAEKRAHLVVIDFGLAEFWFKNGAHLPMRKEDEFKGTMRYASVNSQKYFTQSRRDDLEAVSNALFYLLRGTLPWSGLQAETKAEQFHKVREMKENTPKSVLCAGFPKTFETFAEYVVLLGYKDRPDYAYLYQLFSDLRTELEQEAGVKIEDHDFEWDARSVGAIEPLKPRGSIPQPDDPPEFPPVPCPQCSTMMSWTTSLEGAYAHGWTCDLQRACPGQANCLDGRWYCEKCQGDFCAVCVDHATQQAKELAKMQPPTPVRRRGTFSSLFGCSSKPAIAQPDQSRQAAGYAH